MYEVSEKKTCLDKCQRKREVADGLEYIGKERLENGQGDIKGERAELWQVEATWYRSIALVVLCSTKANINLCFWKGFTTTSLAPSPAARQLHSQPDQQALERQN